MWEPRGTYPVGSTVTFREEAWQVVGIRDYTRELLSLDGTRTRYEAADKLKLAP